MNANKRVRDLSRRSNTRLIYVKGGVEKGTTAYPTRGGRIQRVAA